MEDYDLHVSAPGRLCISGEHQDYFGLPIIAAAINLRISISGNKRKDRKFRIRLPDIKDEMEFLLKKELAYQQERDYIRSAINVVQREGIILSSGWDCLVQGNIPINAGTSSSSALVVAWIKFLLEAVKDSRASNPEKIAELGFSAEVAEFKEPGGKMDHYASSMGGVVSIHFEKDMKIRKLKNPLKEFVLADSLQKKDTTGMLGYIKGNVLRGVSSVKKKINTFGLRSPLSQKVQVEIEKLSQEEKRLLQGTLLTRDLTKEVEALFESDDFDHNRFGQLLSRQHSVLRDYLQISTPKIEKMIEASLSAGSFGAKINGSGGGGCIFAYSPGNAEKVARALKKMDVKAYIIRVDDGARVDKSN